MLAADQTGFEAQAWDITVGCTTLMYDANGAQILEQRYTAWGEPRYHPSINSGQATPASGTKPRWGYTFTMPAGMTRH